MNEKLLTSILNEVEEDLKALESELKRLKNRYTKAGAKRLRKKMMLFCKNRVNYSKGLVAGEKGQSFIFVKEDFTKVQ